MLWPISFQVASDRRDTSPARVIESIRQLHWQTLLQRLLANFPLPERREQLGGAHKRCDQTGKQ
jgi:hypothetical protein